MIHVKLSNDLTFIDQNISYFIRYYFGILMQCRLNAHRTDVVKLIFDCDDDNKISAWIILIIKFNIN